jgi:uncharacterized delta-60 repeat protein
MNVRPVVAVTYLAALAFASDAVARAGDLDPSFGQGGIALYAPTFTGSCRRGGESMALHPDGSIILAGSEYDADGFEALDIAKLNEIGGVIDEESTTYFGQNSESRAVGIDAASGEIYVGADVGNVAHVRAYRPDLSSDDTFGSSGDLVVAVGGDTTSPTRINDLIVEQGDVFLAGTYAPGFQYVMLSRFGGVATNPNPGYFGIFSGFDTGTSVGVYSDLSGAHVLVGGYANNECFTAGFVPVFDAGGHVWNFDFDDNYDSRQYGFAPSQACYTDTLRVLPDNSQIGAGRVLEDDGSWIAYFQQISAGGVGFGLFRLFNMSAWGDNSIRKILVQPDGKWIMVGFTGVDASAVPGAWAGRFNADGSTDASFGSAGSTLIDFDTQDYAYGQALTGALDRYGRVLLAGTEWTGVSDEQGNDCTVAFVARLQSDDLIFADGFDLAARVQRAPTKASAGLWRGRRREIP